MGYIYVIYIYILMAYCSMHYSFYNQNFPLFHYLLDSWFLSHSDVTFFTCIGFILIKSYYQYLPTHEFLPNLPVSPFLPNVMYSYLEHPDIIQYCLYSHVCRNIHWIMKSLSREVYLKTSVSSSAKSHWFFNPRHSEVPVGLNVFFLHPSWSFISLTLCRHHNLLQAFFLDLTNFLTSSFILVP